MSKKTIQFKLPARVAAPDEWVRNRDAALDRTAAPSDAVVSGRAAGEIRPAEILAPPRRALPQLEMADRVVDQFTTAFGIAIPSGDEAAHQSSLALAGFGASGTLLMLGAQDLSRMWLAVTRDAVQRNIDGIDRLMQCRSLPEWISLQSNLVRENLEYALTSASRLAQFSAQVANEAAQAVTVRTGGQADRERRAA